MTGLGSWGGELLTMPVPPEVDTTTLVGRLRKARLEAGLRQQDVAELLGVNVQCVSNWENGRSRPRWVGAEDIERVLAQHGSEP